MNSLQRQITTRVLSATLALSAAAGLGVYLYARHALVRQFDDATTSRASALAALLEIEPAGHLEVEFSHASLPEYYSRSPDRFFDIRREDGSVLVASPSLNGRPLLPAGMSRAQQHAFDMQLPNGRPGRGVVMPIAPWIEPPAPGQKLTHATTLENFTLVIARDRGELDRSLNHLLSGLLIAGAALAGGTTLAVVIIVRRSLRPVQVVAAQAGLIDAESLDRRLPVNGLAAELQPICQCINELIERVETGFKRERQFTANVAHELRTPIAELRALAEVALQRAALNGTTPDPNYRDALDVALQMESVVTSLLALARCHAGTQLTTLGPADLGELVSTSWRKFAATAASRGLHTDFDVPLGTILETDRAMLSATLDNLFSNTVEYAPRGGNIQCGLTRSASRVTLRIANGSAELTEADLARICEPFWRKDAARSASNHTGLGLALVEAYAKLLNIDLQLALPDGRFVVTLTFPFAARPTIVKSTDARSAVLQSV